MLKKHKKYIHENGYVQIYSDASKNMEDKVDVAFSIPDKMSPLLSYQKCEAHG